MLKIKAFHSVSDDVKSYTISTSLNFCWMLTLPTWIPNSDKAKSTICSLNAEGRKEGHPFWKREETLFQGYKAAKVIYSLHSPDIHSSDVPQCITFHAVP